MISHTARDILRNISLKEQEVIVEAGREWSHIYINGVDVLMTRMGINHHVAIAEAIAEAIREAIK